MNACIEFCNGATLALGPQIAGALFGALALALTWYQSRKTTKKVEAVVIKVDEAHTQLVEIKDSMRPGAGKE